MSEMKKAVFRFYEELNDFLLDHRRKADFEAEFEGGRSVGEMIEALGVPHAEIDLILANGEPVDFGYILRDGDRVSVYPVFESLNIEKVTRLRESPLRKIRFIATGSLEDVVGTMRMLGFDVEYDPSLSDGEVLQRSTRTKRIILTRRRDILQAKEATRGILLRPGEIEEQIAGILDRLDLRGQARLFSRCPLCNSPLEPVSKEGLPQRIPPEIGNGRDQYARCKSCGKIYAKGTRSAGTQDLEERILGCGSTGAGPLGNGGTEGAG